MLELGKNLIENLLELIKRMDDINKTACVLTDNTSIFYDVDGGLFLVDSNKNCVSIGLEDSRIFEPLHVNSKVINEGYVIRTTIRDYLDFQNKLIEDDENEDLWKGSEWENEEYFYILYDTTTDRCATIAKGLNNKIISKATSDKYMIWKIIITDVAIV